MFSVLHCLFCIVFLFCSSLTSKAWNEVTLERMPENPHGYWFHKVLAFLAFQNIRGVLEHSTTQRKQTTHTHIICGMIDTALIVNTDHTRKTKS
jgi:hypothetical protein